MSQELIVVKQLPIIEDQLRQVKESIEQRVAFSLSLACTEDTYKEVKRERAALSKEFRLLEDRRKEVKDAILEPYKNFEALYKECAGDIYVEADRKLKDRIAEVENGIKQQKHDDVSAFFEEYRVSKGIDGDLVSFAGSGINITMSSTRKNLREQASAFLERISEDLALIDTMDSKDEIIVEYKKTLNVSQAVTAVAARHKAIEEEAERRKAAADEKAMRSAAQERIEAIVAETPTPEPVPVPESTPIEEKIYSTSFRVTGNLAQLKALKTFLTEGGYTYEQL